MDELNKKNEPIDQDLKGLEMHTPSMRFTKDLVDRVKLETDLIRADQKILPWIPKLCIAGFLLVLTALIVLMVSNDIQTEVIQIEELSRLLSNALVIIGGVALFLGLDRLLKGTLIKP